MVRLAARHVVEVMVQQPTKPTGTKPPPPDSFVPQLPPHNPKACKNCRILELEQLVRGLQARSTVELRALIESLVLGSRSRAAYDAGKKWLREYDARNPQQKEKTT